MAGSSPFYPFRPNLDGSQNSICLQCLKGMHGVDLLALRAAEQLHRCSQVDLRKFEKDPSRMLWSPAAQKGKRKSRRQVASSVQIEMV